MSRRELRQASIHVVEGKSLVVPLIVEGLPEVVECLGQRWQRKREFHLTVIADRLLDIPDRCDDLWDRVVPVASGRLLGPVQVGDELRRAHHPERPGLETLIVMADCPGLDELVGELSQAIRLELPRPPAHVTLYSTDAAQGIGITGEAELADRAPALGPAEQDEVRRAIGW